MDRSFLLLFLLGCAEEEAPAPECTEGYGTNFRNGKFYDTPESYGNATVKEGFISTGLGDIDYTGGDAHVSTFHVRDADDDEDGEILGVYISLSTPAHACDLKIRSNELPLVDDLFITVESDCEGWSNAMEHRYSWDEGSEPSVEVDHRVSGNVAEACFEAELRPQGVVQLESDAGVMTVDLSSIVVEGAVYSYALPE